MNGRIRGLDGVRAICAWAVVGIHLNMVPHLPAPLRNLVEPVSVFFVLSGFLITSNLLREQQETSSISLLRFWRNRAVRIFPVYFAFLTVIAIEMHTHWLGWARVTGQHFTYAASYVSNFLPRPNYSGHLGATWSLAVEEHFYLVWPVLLVLVWRWRVHAAALILVACVAARIFIVSTSDEVMTLRWTIPAADALLIGCLLAFIHQRRTRFPVQKVSSRTHAAAGLTLCAASMLIVASRAVQAVQKTALFIGFALLLGWIVDNQESVAVGILDWKPLRFFGTVSYGIYVWQAIWISTGPADQLHWPQKFPQAIPIIAATAIASYYVIERPFMRLKAPRLQTASYESESDTTAVPARPAEIRTGQAARS